MLKKRLIAVVVVVAICALIAWAVSGGDMNWWYILAIAFGVQWVAFVPSYIFKTEKFYDLCGSATFLACIWSAAVLSDVSNPWQLLVVGLVTIWALRLGSFLFLRVMKTGEDSRFREIKHSAPRFLVAWTLQGAWVFLTLLAALVIVFHGAELTATPWGWAGLAIWIIGFVTEVVADRQKSAFREQKSKEKPFITSGLWKFSRHPNYAGEILLWLGMFIMSVPLLSGWLWLVAISPVFVYLLISRVSGVPMLEEQADKRWGEMEAYQAYKANTPKLFFGN